MNLAELTDDKTKFPQWSVKPMNTLTRTNKGYGWAMERINECLTKARTQGGNCYSEASNERILSGGAESQCGFAA